MVAHTVAAVVKHNLALKVLEALAQFVLSGPAVLAHSHQQTWGIYK
jgi:hypothetical protein